MVMTEIQKLLRTRCMIEKRFRKIEKSIQDHPLVKAMDLIDIDFNLSNMAASRQELDTIHFELMNLIEEADADRHEVDFVGLINLHQEGVTGLERIRASLVVTPAPTAPSTTSTTTNDIKLPRVPLPEFSGDSTEWIAFRDRFNVMVHNNAKIAVIQKFTYLKSSLTGSAAKLIAHLALTEDNYQIAWDIVNKRFQNPRELYNSIMSKLIRHPKVNDNNATELMALVDASNSCTGALANLTIADKFDALLVLHISQKLDSTSRQFWEVTLKDTSIPKSDDLLDFMEKRARSLTAAAPSKPKPPPKKAEAKHQVHVAQAQPAQPAKAPDAPPPPKFTPKCSFCKEEHFTFRCPTLIAIPVADRSSAVKKKHLCLNCLRSGHFIDKCDKLEKKCQKCNKNHHTLLHFETPPATVGTTALHSSKDHTYNLLATALVKATGDEEAGNPQFIRVLLDGGSMVSLITENCVNRLGLFRKKTTAQISGLASADVGRAKGVTSLKIQTHFPTSEAFHVHPFILPKITEKLPSIEYEPSKWNHIQGIQLADPLFHKPDEIDLLIGADLFFSLLLPGKKTGPSGTPSAIQTKLGWIVAGPTEFKTSKIKVNVAEIQFPLEKFWEMESLPKSTFLTAAEKECEEHFQKNVYRSQGRYIVSIPLKTPPVPLGPSRDLAIKYFHRIEKRMANRPDEKAAYVSFMQEYERMGHMRQMTAGDKSTAPFWNFIPHHCVSPTPEKFRVVFNASIKTSTGYSFNDAQMVGPTVQNTLYSILLRFRRHPVAFKADVSKMYRQILIDPSQHHLQCIVWRENPEDPLKEYQLQTVTYGTASAPFLATRALNQIAMDGEWQYPLAASVVKQDFYVDDLLSSQRTPQVARKVISELQGMTANAGLTLRKFASNVPAILSHLDEDFLETSSILPMEESDSCVKALGIHWNTEADAFFFAVRKPQDDIFPLTKRVILSHIAQLFDPIGWLAPAIITAKILMQDIWREKTGWDEVPSDAILSRWQHFNHELTSLEQIQISRCLCPPCEFIELHGFCDASEKAYSAVAYVRVLKTDGAFMVNLVASKTKVAPLHTVSLPRLELCGALLLAELLESIQASVDLPFQAVHGWTDSTIVLAWLSSSPSKWKTFVANRVSKIQEILPRTSWSHISGLENPADCASRGVMPSELVNHPLWFTGPPWLSAPFSPSIAEDGAGALPPDDVDQADIEQETRAAMIGAARLAPPFLKEYSSLIKSKRVMAYALRFIHNCRRKAPPLSGPLKPSELESSFKFLLKEAQQSFSKEIQCLQDGSRFPALSKIQPLTPFLDSDGILRVGGRLRHAKLTPDKRNPILLSNKHHLTRLIIDDVHQANFHSGPQLTQALIFDNFWIIRGRDAIRHRIKQCVTCSRHRASPLHQIMGDLPADRVNPSRPFTVVGVDYAGPLLLKPIAPRSKITHKAYIAVFVCYATKAIHLELVSSLSTAAFLAALRRFVARRGRPSKICSDNGTNFVGANSELKKIQAFIDSNAHNQEIANFLSGLGISWHFNPPGAPHFGGLWEAGVKSVKQHLYRVIGKTRLTFEEMTTILCQIEACLNSRPLTPFSTDPADLTALTPAHFLVGGNLLAVPDHVLLDVPQNRLTRWQLIQQLVQHFWTRWSKEFLSRLQQRPKWNHPERDIQVNDLVLVKSEGMSPTHWPLARVLTVHPGKDGHVRVATLRTASGELKRPIAKLCLLPVDDGLSEVI